MNYLAAPPSPDWALCVTLVGPGSIQCVYGQQVGSWLSEPLGHALALSALIAVVALLALWRLSRRGPDPVVRP